MSESTGRWVVLLPTLQEAGSIATVIADVLAASPRFDVLVVDDRSNDGTAELVRKIAGAEGRVSLVVREGPRSRGQSAVQGMCQALASRGALAECGATIAVATTPTAAKAATSRATDTVAGLVEMDADGSHRAADAAALVDRLEARELDLVIGSRFVRNGVCVQRAWHRRVLTATSNAFVRCWLGLWRIKDPNSGLRAWSFEALQRIEPATLRARGPSHVQEALFRAKRARLQIAEHPIRFEPRSKGCSKLALGRLLGVLRDVLRLRFGAWRPSRELGAPAHRAQSPATDDGRAAAG